MAHASWLWKSTSSGSGNDNVSFRSTTANTGRSPRVTRVTFSAVGVSDVDVEVTQQGKPKYVLFDNTSPSMPATGGSPRVLTLYGTSNAQALTFTKANDGIGLTIPSTYTAAGISGISTSGGTITGDPGNTEEFAWEIAFTIPENTGVTAKTCQIIVSDGTNTHTCTITLSAGNATLSVSPTTVTLAWDATTQQSAVSVTVTSNTSWTIA